MQVPLARHRAAGRHPARRGPGTVGREEQQPLGARRRAAQELGRAGVDPHRDDHLGAAQEPLHGGPVDRDGRPCGVRVHCLEAVRPRVEVSPHGQPRHLVQHGKQKARLPVRREGDEQHAGLVGVGVHDGRALVVVREGVAPLDPRGDAVRARLEAGAQGELGGRGSSRRRGRQAEGLRGGAVQRHGHRDRVGAGGAFDLDAPAQGLAALDGCRDDEAADAEIARRAPKGVGRDAHSEAPRHGRGRDGVPDPPVREQHHLAGARLGGHGHRFGKQRARAGRLEGVEHGRVRSMHAVAGNQETRALGGKRGCADHCFPPDRFAFGGQGGHRRARIEDQVALGSGAGSAGGHRRIPEERHHAGHRDKPGRQQQPAAPDREFAPEIDPAAEASGQKQEGDQQDGKHAGPAGSGATGRPAPPGVRRGREG